VAATVEVQWVTSPIGTQLLRLQTKRAWYTMPSRNTPLGQTRYLDSPSWPFARRQAAPRVEMLNGQRPASVGHENRVAAQIPTADEIRAIVQEAVAPLRLELERLRSDSERSTLVSLPQAARRLGVTLRAVQRWAKDGRLDIVPVGGLRMVRLPNGTQEK